ncbi:MAG: ABC transporter permease subunit [Methanocalculus sp.]|uniref:ABC transporter permease n=1 Tax=Methanocalculus sp. TaxID=2004547 RepID=UPI002719690F|nr:ABC transporter permease subunit [Methanocalculus sp.]MDO9538858.1 ABC transporter permease subunit [Methanocalculus sp.]
MSNALFVIAGKEFSDSFRNRTILAIFAIFFAIMIIGMISGISQYQDIINSYNEHLAIIGSQGEEFMGGFMDYRPSTMIIFSSVGSLLVTMGSLLGITVGFDLITREREAKTLRILLSHPVFRDEVINGKAIGAGGALAAVFAATIGISVALLLIAGIVPSGDEWSSIMIFAISAFLMIIAYFAIALCMSALSETSGAALIYTLIIFIILSSLLPVLIQHGVADAIAGEQPKMPQIFYSDTVSVYGEGEVGAKSIRLDDDDFQRYQEEIQAWWSRRQAIIDTASLFSPTMNFEKISTTLMLKSTFGSGESISAMYSSVTTFGSDDGIIAHIIALLALPAIFFGIAYMRFMRMDLR